LPRAPRPADNGAVAPDHAEHGETMKLSRACGYALHALTYLARNPGGGPVASHTIAEAEGLPGGFLLKSLTPLVAAGVLRSDLGLGGGFRLARPAGRITLLEVVEALDGPVRGEAPGVGGGEHARFDAKLKAVCDGAAEAVRRRLGKVSLADLAREG
jgi:Rrf2 family protein